MARFSTGPHRAHDLASGSEFEVSNGYLVRRPPRSAAAGAALAAIGGLVGSDPLVRHAGIDIGYAPVPHMLRAPDVSVFDEHPGSDWIEGVPVLAIEYADRDEAYVDQKLVDLLECGAKRIWVVRPFGVRRVEEHMPGSKREFLEGEVVFAPNVLGRPIPVEALYDPDLSRSLVLDNLRRRAVRGSLIEGREEGLRAALRAVLASRGFGLDEAAEGRIEGADAERLERWLLGAVTAPTLADALEG